MGRNINNIPVAGVKELTATTYIWGGGGARCPNFNLKETLLPESPPYGQWYYKGYDASSPLGAFVDTPVPNFLNPHPVNNQIGSNFRQNVETTNAVAGYYKLWYEHGNYDEDGNFIFDPTLVTDEVILQIFPSTECAGGDSSVNRTTAGSVDLDTLLPSTACGTPTTGGVWTDDDSIGASFNPGTGILDLSTAPAGTYNFTYSILPSGFSQGIKVSTCPDASCLEQTATITVIIKAGLVVAITPATVTCTVTQVFRDPDTLVVGDIKTYVQNDVEGAVLHGETYISDDCGIFGASEDNIFRTSFLYSVANIGDPTNRMEEGGHFVYLDFATKALAQVRVPLAPDATEGYKATLTGSYGTVNPSELVFSDVDQENWKTAVEICIKNHLETLGYDHGTHYRFSHIDVLPVGTGVWEFKFWVRIKHNPTGEWLGFDKVPPSIVQFDKDGGATYSTLGVGNIDFIVEPVDFQSYSSTIVGCVNHGDLLTHYQIPSPVFVFDTVTSNHFTIVLNGTTVTAVLVGNSNTKACTDSKQLTASVLPACGGTLTYLWSNGDTTAATHGFAGDGLFTVTANCTSPADSDDETITI